MLEAQVGLCMLLFLLDQQSMMYSYVMNAFLLKTLRNLKYGMY